MAQNSPHHTGLTLYTQTGERKYLSSIERSRFFNSIGNLCNPFDRTFCEMLFWTGCRPSEALALTAMHIDVDDAVVVIQSLKKRGDAKGNHFRAIPVPKRFIELLRTVHFVKAKQLFRTGGQHQRLWQMSRSTAWKRVKRVMEEADIHGVRASAKGLRHTYGVHAVLSNVPETRIKKWLGHNSLATTEIYLDVVAGEDRALAERMWEEEIPNRR